MSACLMTTTTLEEHAGCDSEDWINVDGETSVVRTPKTTILALVIAVIAGLIAYQQSPGSSDASASRQQRFMHENAAVFAPQDQQAINTELPPTTFNPIEYWAAVEAATMNPALDG